MAWLKEKFKTVISLSRAILLQAMIRWSHAINIGFLPCSVHHAVVMLNNNPKHNGFTPKQTFTCVKGARSFRNFHTFVSPTHVLHSTIDDGNKLPTWKLRSKPTFFLGKSLQHASNISLVH